MDPKRAPTHLQSHDELLHCELSSVAPECGGLQAPGLNINRGQLVVPELLGEHAENAHIM